MKLPSLPTFMGLILGFVGVRGAETSASPPVSVAATMSPDAGVATLRAELEAMLETDQSQRKLMAEVEKQHGQNSPEVRELWRKQTEIDGHNIARLEAIIAEQGWPKRSVIGEKASSAAFLILQHADISYQKKYVALAREAVAAKEMKGSSLALLEDRILLREGKKQIYGSQVRRNEAGDWEVSPIEDEANVDQRRAAVGLQPLAQYLQGFADRGGGKVADRKNDLALEGAPPLAQSLFAETDDARAAYEKLRKIPPQRGAPSVQFQLACRDFCVRFPKSSFYGPVRVLAARYYGWLSEADLAQLHDWVPAAGERDPALTPEQRADVALQIALAKAGQSEFATGPDAGDASLDRIALALAPHRRTNTGRAGLIAAALEASASKAIPMLREAYPDDPEVASAIAALELIGKPYELQFTALDGRAVDLRNLRGKVVLVAFLGKGGDWMTKVLTEMKEMAVGQGVENFAIVGVSMEKDRLVTQTMVDENKIAWPMYWDGRGWENALAQRFLVKISPYYLLIDRQGVLRFRGVGPNSEVAKKRMELLVAEKPPN